MEVTFVGTLQNLKNKINYKIIWCYLSSLTVKMLRLYFWKFVNAISLHEWTDGIF